MTDTINDDNNNDNSNENYVNDDFAIYFDYNINDPPEKLKNSTRFVLISDTHNRLFNIPNGDILIHAGDITDLFYRQIDYTHSANWINSQSQFKYKFVIAGNHDRGLIRNQTVKDDGTWFIDYKKDQSPNALEYLCGVNGKQNNVYYLQNNSKIINVENRDWHIYGSPIYPNRRPTAFTQKQTIETVKSFPQMDVLITHGPPRGILDKTQSGLNVGSFELTEAIQKLKPRLHVCGHIHEGRGYKVVNYDNNLRTLHVNAANVHVDRLFNRNNDDLDAIIVDLKN